MAQSAYTVTQLDESTWALDEGLVRSYLLVGEEKALLIDTGNGAGDLPAEVRALTALPVMLVNTHADGDHMACNEAFDCAWLHPSEFDRYEKRYPNHPHAPLQDGEEIDLGGRVVRVLLIPGHTPGSIALLDVSHRQLFSGDSVSASAIFMFGEGRSLRALCSSLKRLQALQADYDRILPAHGPCPIEKDTVDRLLTCAQACMAGKVEDRDPSFPVDAREYSLGGVGFFLK